MVRFLADMPVSPLTVAMLRTRGYDALHVREREMQQAADEDILSLARQEERIVLTMDLDFGTLLALGHGTEPGVIIFRLTSNHPDFVNSRLLAVLNTLPEKELFHSITIVEDEKIRRRTLPI